MTKRLTPPIVYTDNHGIKSIRTSERPEADRADVEEWMAGQTRPWIDGIPEKDQDCWYVWDWDTWQKGRKKGLKKPSIIDWYDDCRGMSNNNHRLCRYRRMARDARASLVRAVGNVERSLRHVRRREPEQKERVTL